MAEILAADEFRFDEDLVYLNHAGVAPWPRRAAEAVAAFGRENAARGAAGYGQWLKVEADLRRRLAALVNARSIGEIALLKNTSEGLSFVASGLDWSEGDNIVTSDEEFPSNRIVWEALAPRGVTLRRIPLRSASTPSRALIGACDARTRLIAVSSVQYGTGLRVDLQPLGQQCRARGILLCVDAIQTLGALALDVQECEPDFLVADGHKWMLGPEGVALFYVRANRCGSLRPSEYGWHMVARAGDYDRLEWEPAADARRFECGSPNLLGAHALNASLSLLEEIGIERIERQVLDRTAWLHGRLGNDPRFRIVSPADPALASGIFTFQVVGHAPDEIVRMLRSRGVVAAPRAGGVRFSPHFYTPWHKLERALDALRTAAA
ncbi:MAG: aminotransferase class V-fold PLP-dependent enzyme [Gammaproteobacteria bacterium]